MDIYGVDTFDGWWGEWSERLVPGALGRIAKIDGDRLPFQDLGIHQLFSNQVSKHIPNPRQSCQRLGEC